VQHEGDEGGHPERSRRAGDLVGNGELGATGQKIYDFIRESHAATGLVPTVREIREAIGVSSIGTVGYWLDKLEELNLIRRDSGKNRSIQLSGESPTVSVPLVGEIRAGAPIVAEERIEGTFQLPRRLVGEGTLFMLRVRGDSMIDAQIAENDYVVVREQPDAENAQGRPHPPPAGQPGLPAHPVRARRSHPRQGGNGPAAHLGRASPSPPRGPAPP
jgi:repressor LexA